MFKNISKDTIAIIDKYLHRYKWTIVNDEYNNLLRYWCDINHRFYWYSFNANYRNLNEEIYYNIYRIRSDEKNIHTKKVFRLPDNYVHAKLYK